MTGRAGAGLLRSQAVPERATFLELFLDLVFVFALTRLSASLLGDLTWIGAFRTAILLVAITWVWTQTLWMTDVLNPRHPLIQLAVIAIMFGALVMAVAVPEAFGSHGLVFAIAYVGIQVGRPAYFTVVLRGERRTRRDVQRVLFAEGLCALLWLAGAFTHDAARESAWLAAIVLTLVLQALHWPAPGLGRTPTSELAVAPEHVSDRYRQLLIIALGETVLVTGATFSAHVFSSARWAALVAAFIGSGLLWWIYLHRGGEELGSAIANARDRYRLGRSAYYSHLLMVAGIVVTAVGFELVIAHPSGRTPPAWAAVILGGPALFLAGRDTFEYVLTGRVSWRRRIGVLVLAALAAATPFVPPLLVVAAVDLTLAGTTFDLRTLRRTR